MSFFSSSPFGRRAGDRVFVHDVSHQFKLPELESFVGAAAGKSAQIGAEADGPGLSFVGLRLLQQSPGSHIENLQTDQFVPY